MKAFWWFKEKSIAGMARPGFNKAHWFDLPFEEALVYGWLGQRCSDLHEIDSVRSHVQKYGSKIFRYHKVDELSFFEISESFKQDSRIAEVLNRLAEKTGTLQQFELVEGKIRIHLAEEQLNREIEFLKGHGAVTFGRYPRTGCGRGPRGGTMAAPPPPQARP